MSAMQTRLYPAPQGGLIIEKAAAAPDARRSLERELELLARLPREGFAEPLDRHEDAAGLRVRCRVPFERRLDLALDAGLSLAPAAALRLCRALARCVAALHAEGLTDKHLTTARFYLPLDPQDERVCLAELGRVSRPAVEERQAGALAWIEGDLHFLAPEQTGRMNRAIDARSDLYTLGVIFYRVLTGVLPFTGDDDLALVHAHLSLAPVAPSVRVPGFPRAWERLLLRLLAKNAEDRYQTADGLVADLDWLIAHEADAAALDGFRPGMADHASTLVVPEKLYGRAPEVALLMEHFGRVVAGARTLLLVAGSSGVGKSSLINEVHRPITAARGTFVAGKFDQYQRDQPLVAVLGALRELVRRLLAEPDAAIARWRALLAEALEGEGRVLVELLPEIGRLLDDPPPLPAVEPAEAAARMKRVFQRFIRTFGRPEHPLVIFLDDLQWADAASLRLLEALLTDERTGHLMVIGAYRSNEVGAGHLVTDWLTHVAGQGTVPVTLALEPLAPGTVAELLADTLRVGRREATPLATLLHEKTEGSPFYLKVLLQTLVDRGKIVHDRAAHRWRWDLPAVAAESVSGNVVDMVLASLRELPPGAADTLSRAAFVGASFTFAELRAVVPGGDALALHDELDLLEQRRYLLRAYGSAQGQIRFQHDRIQEAAYELCPADARRGRHVEVGERLAALEPDLPRAERLFAILQHLNHGLDRLGAERQRELLALNLAAGLRAKRSLAYASAVRMLGLVHERLDEATWQADPAFAFRAAFEYAHTLFLDGGVPRAIEVVDALVARAGDAMALAAVHNLRLTLHSFQGRYAEALAAGRSALAALDMDFPERDYAGHVERLAAAVQARLHELAPERVAGHHLMTDPATQLAMTVLKGIVAASFGYDDLLFRASTALSVDLTLREGLAQESAYLLCAYAMVVWRRPEDEALAVQLGHTGLAIAERFGNKQSICQACEVLVGHLNHWTRPLEESRELNRRAFESGMEAGEPQFVSYTFMYHGLNLYHLGTPLPQLVEQTGQYAEFARACGNRLAMHGLEAIRLVAALLGAETPLGPRAEAERREAELLAGWRANSSTVAVMLFLVARAQVHVLMGEDAAAAPLLAEVRAEDPTISMSGMVSVAVHRFLEMLLAARSAPADGPGRAAALAALQAHREPLARWAGQAPANFAHYLPALDGEQALLEGRAAEAVDHLERAVELAESRMALDAVLLAERAADLCYRQGEAARADGLLQRAMAAALALGAQHKAAQLRRLHPLLEGAALAGQGEARRSLAELELGRVLDIIAAFSREIGLEALVGRIAHTLLELSGASGFALLLPREDGQWRLRATLGLDGAPALGFDDVAFDEAAARLPQRPIRLALNSGQPLVADRPADDLQFADDAYLQRWRPGAILCLPVAVGPESVGLIYLENALASGVFTPAALHLVQALSGQIGISLLNAVLYERMEDRVRQRTAALQEANANLESLADTLRRLGNIGQDITAQLSIDGVIDTLGRHVAGLVAGARLVVHRAGSGDDLAAAPEVREAALRRAEALDASGRSLALPLVAGDRLTGVLHVARPAEAPLYDQRERLILRTLAAHAAIALDNAAAYDELDAALRRLKETQDQLVVKEKMAALGQLTAGVAHEIQNPLNFVTNFAVVSQDVLDELRELTGAIEPAPPWRAQADEALELLGDNLELILNNGRRASATVRSMLAHSRSGAGRVDRVDLNLLVNERVQAQLQDPKFVELAQRVDVQWMPDGALRPVETVAQDIANVLDNLLRNAFYAMTEKLRSGAPGYAPVLGLATRATGTGAEILVRDNGTGIPEENQRKLFTPFFTTKPAGDGSGLGLSLSYDLIVKRHRGRLSIESVPGESTQVRIQLPLRA